MWLHEFADARNVYYVQSLSSMSLAVTGYLYLYGGFFSAFILAICAMDYQHGLKRNQRTVF